MNRAKHKNKVKIKFLNLYKNKFLILILNLSFDLLGGACNGEGGVKV